MKEMAFRNKLNGEKFFCYNVRDVEVIDGVDYLKVHKPGQNRTVLMRKDVLEKDPQTVKKFLGK